MPVMAYYRQFLLGPKCKPYTEAIEQVASEDYDICNMDTVLFLLHIRGLKQLLVFYFRVEEKFAGGKFRGRKISREENFEGGKFREIPFAVDIYFAGGKFRANSKFANIAEKIPREKYVLYSTPIPCFR